MKTIAEIKLEKILDVINDYLPPDGISIKDAMSKIIEIIDPMGNGEFD